MKDKYTKIKEASKEEYDEIASKFRNEACKDPVKRLKLDYKNYEYTKVITDMDGNPTNYQDYEDKDWEIVLTEKEGRLTPVTGMHPKSMKHYVLMRRTHENRLKHEQTRQEKDKADLIRSMRSERAKVEHKGNQVKITYEEIKPDEDI